MSTIDPDFTSVEDVVNALSINLGNMILEVIPGTKVIRALDTIPKVEGPYVLIDESALDQSDWISSELRDEDGNVYTIQNYVATYTLTAYRGKPHITLARLLQSFGLPYFYDKYFPTGSPYAYSSASTVAKMRVPLNAQFYEDRARVQILFNLAFISKDLGSYEIVDQVNIDLGVTYVDDRLEVPVQVDISSTDDTTTTP